MIMIVHDAYHLYQLLAQWATIAHHGASIMFGDTIIYDAQRQENSERETVTRN